MNHFLIDTNVVIDFLTDRRPFSIAATRLFDYSEKRKVNLYLTTVSYNNLYYILKKLSSHKETIRILKELESITSTINTTGEVVRQALNSDFRDFEDAIQYYTARTIKKINGIVTRNVVDFKLSKIPILTPEEAIGVIENNNN